MNRRSVRNAPSFAPRSIFLLALVGAAACGLPSVDDLFVTAGGAGGATSSSSSSSSSASSSSGATSSSSSSSSGTSSSSSSSSSSGTSSSSSSSSSSSGGPVCGDGVCSPGEEAVFCPQDCTSGCAHDTCDTGDPLPAACSTCATTVCASDEYCCTTAWDAQCVNEAAMWCGACCGNGVCNDDESCSTCEADCGACPPPLCAHSVCITGDALSLASCPDPCVDEVCAQKPTCCGNASFDDSCQALADQLCGVDPCLSAICSAMPTCCTQGFTQACVDLAKTTCQTGCDCAHSICQEGPALAATCNPCAKAVCAADAYCCTSAWDGPCVGEATSICNITCQ